MGKEAEISGSTGVESAEALPAIRVLIVDDESCISELLAEMLRILGYEPRKCYSPQAALELLAKENFDVVLSDFRMPKMTGEQFYTAATARQPYLAERFAFLTGDTLCDETQGFLQRTRRPHLAKPFNLADLEQIIAEISGRRATPLAA